MRKKNRSGKFRRIASATSEALSDKELVKKAKRELPYVTNAFEALMRRYDRTLFRTCRRLLDNTSDAEDATQEIMLKVFHGITRFQERSTFKTWLFRIAYNVCHTRYQCRARERERLVAYTQQLSTETDHTTERLDVDRLLAGVSVTDRTILTLRFVVELTIEEIAEILDMRLSATKMRLYRAMEKLKQSVDN